MRPAPLRPLVLAAAVCGLLPLLPADARAQDPGRDAVARTITRVFEGMRTADSAMIRAAFLPGARFASVAPGGDSVRYEAIDGWLRGVAASGGRWDEQVYDVEVQVDGAIAQVWAPYTFYLDRAVRHCGVNAVSLLRVGGEWRVAQWSDTRRREGCRDPLGTPGGASGPRKRD